MPFSSSVGYVLSELSTMSRPSWVALQGMFHSFKGWCELGTPGTWVGVCGDKASVTATSVFLQNG